MTYLQKWRISKQGPKTLKNTKYILKKKFGKNEKSFLIIRKKNQSLIQQKITIINHFIVLYYILSFSYNVGIVYCIVYNIQLSFIIIKKHISFKKSNHNYAVNQQIGQYFFPIQSKT